MTSVRAQKRPARRSQAFEAPTNRVNNENYEDPLVLNKPGPSEAATGPEAPVRPPQAPPSAAPDVARYTQKDMDHLLQTFLQASKGGSSDKLKAKTLDVYCNRSYMECYNFCQQYEDHFTTCGVTGLNRIPFAAFFLWD